MWINTLLKSRNPHGAPRIVFADGRYQETGGLESETGGTHHPLSWRPDWRARHLPCSWSIRADGS